MNPVSKTKRSFESFCRWFKKTIDLAKSVLGMKLEGLKFHQASSLFHVKHNTFNTWVHRQVCMYKYGGIHKEK